MYEAFLQKCLKKKGFFQGLREGLSANMEMLSAFCEPDCDALQPVLLWDVIQLEQRSSKDAEKNRGTTACVCCCNASEDQHAWNEDLLRTEDNFVGPHNYNLFKGWG